MLVLTRKNGEAVSFTHPDGTRVELIISRANGGRATIKINAPQSIRILRKEIEDKLSTEKQCPSS
jgi:carbon storage regulator CsrA